MSPFMSNDRPSLHDHFSEPSSTGSTFATAGAFGLRLIRRFGAGAFGLAGVAAVPVWAKAVGAATSIVVDSAPTTVAISSFFMGETFLSKSVELWTAARHGRQGRTARASRAHSGRYFLLFSGTNPKFLGPV